MRSQIAKSMLAKQKRICYSGRPMNREGLPREFH
jgi:hypothetical protein